MKKQLIYLTIFVSVILLSFTADKKPKHITFTNAISKSYIKTEINGKGGHLWDVIKLKIKNIFKKDTTFYLEPGHRFYSEDTTIQDILIVKGEKIYLKSGEEKTIDCYGFCCQAHNGSPYEKSVYNAGKMADTNLIMLSNYINQNLEITLSNMQAAVWVLSDNNPISSIIVNDDKNKDKAFKLKQFVASIKGIRLDNLWYSLIFAKDTNRLFSGVPEILKGEINYQINNYSPVNIILYNDRRKVLSRFMVGKPHHPGKYSYPVEFSVKNWQKGNYYIKLFANNKLLLSRKFVL